MGVMGEALVATLGAEADAAARADLRWALTGEEYRRVIMQLDGALEAVDLIAARAPWVLHRFLCAGWADPPAPEIAELPEVRDAALPDDARAALAALVHELRPGPPLPAKFFRDRARRSIALSASALQLVPRSPGDALTLPTIATTQGSAELRATAGEDTTAVQQLAAAPHK
jgi:hypothetical protein